MPRTACSSLSSYVLTPSAAATTSWFFARCSTPMTPRVQHRAHLRSIAEQTASEEPWFGIEREYTFFDGSRPLGWPKNGFLRRKVATTVASALTRYLGARSSRTISTRLNAGLQISGINAEVMPAQWEFQVGPLGALEVADQLWIARWLLYRVAEDYGVSATLHPSPSRDGTVPALTPTTPLKAVPASYEPIIAGCGSEYTG